MRLEAVTMKPHDGGRLMTRPSNEKPGLADYTIKRNMRRDLDQEIRREGYDYFWPNTADPYITNPGTQPFPAAVAGDDITLVHVARRPNGDTAIIVGTLTDLYRFMSTAGGNYFATDYFEPLPAANAPYFEENTGGWIKIGSGFSTSGKRWEAVNINGYAVFNNGVDLPVTYRLEDSQVYPIYELREQGVASVGTIAQYNGILMCADISEIFASRIETLFDLSGVIYGGDITATQAANTVTLFSPFFSADMVGKTLYMSGATPVNITAVSAPIAPQVLSVTATVDGPATTVSGGRTFFLKTRASQTGSTWSGAISGSQAAGGFIITASSAIFSAPMVGSVIRFANGFSAVITGFTDTTHVTVDTAPVNAITATPFFITTAVGGAAYVVTAASDFFTPAMVGLQIIWGTGQVRKIINYTSATQVVVDMDVPIVSGLIEFENSATYGLFTDQNYINRTQYKILWSLPNEPRRFGPLVAGNMLLGSKVISLNKPFESIEVGQEIIIIGAGESGGNLTTTVTALTYLGTSLTVADPALTKVIGAYIGRSDVVGSMLGYENLEDDGSGILKMLELQGALVIYKDTSIFLATYTGLVAAPFNFQPVKIPDGRSLFYRNTLIGVNGLYHLYAGSNSFYRFDLTTRIPEEIAEFELCSDVFFSQATLANTESIFSADNGMTNEVMIWFPSASSEKALCFDYKYRSMSTYGLAATAAATIKKPAVGVVVGVTEDWFVMGLATGVLVQYGKADPAQAQWANAKEIFYIRNAYPFSATTQNGLDSELDFGMGNFGDDFNEKDVAEYVLYIASTASTNCSIDFKLYGARNVAENPVLLLSRNIPTPKSKNLLSIFYRKMYFQDRLTVVGKDNPCRIMGRTWRGSGLDTRSGIRRQ